jgi:hypothetical protein
MNADKGKLAQITTTGIARHPVCSADSQEVKFKPSDGNGTSLWSIPIAGGTPKELLRVQETTAAVEIWRDGKLAGFGVASQLTYHLEVVNLTSSRVIFHGSMDASNFGKAGEIEL